MDEEEAIARYYEQTGQTREEIPRYPFTTVAAERARSIFWTRVVVILFVAGVLAVGGYGGWHYWQREGKRLWEQRGSRPAPVPENQEPARAPVAPSSEGVSAPSSVSAEAGPTMVSPSPAPSISSVSQPLEIRLEATGNCWISVQVDDEPKPRQEMLRAGDVRTFRPQKQVRLSVGSVPALKVTINGQPAQLPSVGHVARGVIITPENARQFITP